MAGFWSRERSALLAIFVLAALVRFAFWSELRGTSLDQWQRFDQSDMATYIEQAQRIRTGDLLQPDPYHPYHTWQTVAPAAKWLEWYGPHSFHQAPAYSYLLAAAQPVAGADFALVKAVQLLLGAGSCALIFLIARQLAGLRAALAAGLLSAVYGPLLFLEAQLLREGPALFCILAIIYALIRHLERESWSLRSIVLTSLALGACTGAFAMFHEMGSVLMLVLLLSLAVGHLRSGWRAGAIAVGCAVIGWLIGFAPLFARNVAVGAPPFSVSCRTVINFVESNVADAPDAGATFSPPGPTVVRVLDEAHDSGLAALAAVWKTYEGNLGRALENLMAKFRANWLDWEIPDNTSFDFFRDHAATLHFAPTFAVLFPLGLAGMLAMAWHVLKPRTPPAQPTKKELKRSQAKSEVQAAITAGADRKLASHLVLFLLFIGLTSALSLVHTVARFRMYLVPILLIYAGILLALLWDSLREKRLGKAAILALLAAAAFAYQQSIPTKRFERGVRPVDYMVASKLAIERGDFDEARRFNDEARVEYPQDGSVPTAAARELEQAGQREIAIEFYRRAIAIDPNAQFARAALQRLKAN